MQCGDVWSVGSLRKAGAWAGRCGWGWSAGLVVHERLGQTGFVSRLCLDGRTGASRTRAVAKPKPIERDAPFGGSLLGLLGLAVVVEPQEGDEADDHDADADAHDEARPAALPTAPRSASPPPH